MAKEITTLSIAEPRRQALADYRDERELPNMDAAVRELLEHSEAYP